MGKPEVFQITFTEGKKVYYPGQMVTGNVVTKSRKKLKFRTIRMEFLGEARVAKSNREEWNRVESYFDEKVEIYGKEDGQGGSYPVIEPGEHLFPFHFQIPHRRLPSSFEGKFGCIRYSLKATMDRPWKSNYNSKCAITILEVVDINESWALAPIVMERELQAQFMCFKRGSIVAQIKTDRRGYCPGEAIALTGGFCNYTNSTTKPITVSLYQKTIYTQGTKTNEVNKCVKASKDKILKPNDTHHLDNQMFSIPVIPPSITNCRFIKVSYILEVCVACSRGTLSFGIPITIGTVPYRPIIPSAPPVPGSAASLPRYPSPSAPPFEMNLPSYADAMATTQQGLPPSYAECILGSAPIWDQSDGTTGDIMGDTSFTPMYAFVSNYEFRPSTAGTVGEDQNQQTTSERQIDAIDDGLSDSMDEQSN